MKRSAIEYARLAAPQPTHLVDRGRLGCTAGEGGVLDGVGRPMSGARGGDELDEHKVDAAGGQPPTRA